MKKCILVGYGNILRGDDGLGPLVAEHLEHEDFAPGVLVRIFSLPQLDLSLVAELQDADVVVFVDARQDDMAELLFVEPIEPQHLPDPSACATHSTHALGIAALLAITRNWYGKAPRCYIVKPKGFDFSVGAAISEKGNQAAEQAEQAIRRIFSER